MLMQLKGQSHLVEIVDLQALINPYEAHVTGRLQWGEEEQDAEPVDKQALCFLSGEALPRCWVDSHYRENTGVTEPAVAAGEIAAELRFNDTQVPSIY
ncbi:acetyltransferase [Exilibacterium tricleocarpae]|uniref:acetyltransferase n=1 Tax=Exilibacterium tricleocarpae TaxID=2591008 RepID=UPI001C55171F|nr:acetyltransferase [Exilibacterium tricleocarpae]